YGLLRQRLLEEGTQEPPRPSAFSRLWGKSFGDAPLFRFAVLEGEDKRLVGMMSLHRAMSAKTGMPTLHVKDMFVVPEERRKGHARALVQFAERQAQALGAARLELHVGRANEAAQQLYLQQGFTELPYAWMRKELSPAGAAPAARADGAWEEEA